MGRDPERTARNKPPINDATNAEFWNGLADKLREATIFGNSRSIVSEMRLQDANGTGKVVLIAIERSMAAWLRLREALPQREDDILAMLALLDKMQQGIHAALPGVQTFLRPGFDGEPPDDDE